jgi:hypothetical protein
VADATDCDDTDALTNPAGTEVCGGGDENCDGTEDEATARDAVDYYDDLDGDGYGDPATLLHGCLPAGAVTDGSDCDDGDAAVSPAATEVCGDAVDDDCDGQAQACFAGDYEVASADLAIAGTPGGSYFGYNAAAGDLSGDGQDDLVVVGLGASLSYFEGPVTATSASGADFSFSGLSGAGGYGSRGLWADRDVTGDGVADLVVHPCTQSSSDSVCVAAGPLLSTANFYPRFTASSGYTLTDAELGDIDGNGVAELLALANTSVLYAYQPGDPSFYYSNAWVGVTGPWVGKISGISADGVASGGDFTGDGIDDVVTISNEYAWVFDTMTTATTAADAVAYLTHTSTYDDAYVVGDTDGDGLDDLFWGSPSENKAWLLTDPTAGGAVSSVAAASFTSSGSSSFPQSPDSADIDADGFSDLMMGSFDQVDSQVWLTYGPLSGAHVMETDADAIVLNPGASSVDYEYQLTFALGDVLGTGNPVMGYGAPSYGTKMGYLWLFDGG